MLADTLECCRLLAWETVIEWRETMHHPQANNRVIYNGQNDMPGIKV